MTHLFLYLMMAYLAARVMIFISVAIVIHRAHRPERIRIYIKRGVHIDIKQGKPEIEAERPSHARHIRPYRRLG